MCACMYIKKDKYTPAEIRNKTQALSRNANWLYRVLEN